jgi:hypothetical protein
VAARGAHQNRRPPRKSTPKITTKKDVVGRRVTAEKQTGMAERQTENRATATSHRCGHE